MGPIEKLLSKLLAGAIGAVTTIATQRLLKAAWKFVTGKEPPSPTDPDTSLVTAVIWAMASAVGVSVAQLLTQRMAMRRFRIGNRDDSPDTDKLRVKI